MFHCGTMQEVCGNASRRTRRARSVSVAAVFPTSRPRLLGSWLSLMAFPTTDNLEQYGKAVARQPILPEYGTLNPPASPPEVTEEFDGVRWKCLK